MTATATEPDTSVLAEPIFGEHIQSRAWTAAAAYKYCEQIARSHYENFPVGSALIPGRLRKHFYAIYAFARTADDFADEGCGAGCSREERLGLLATWGEMLKQAYSSAPTHPIFIALAETVSRFDLPLELFEDLLSAFTQDVTTRRYRDQAQLADYCRRSANPVGRLILLLFGYRDERLDGWSDDICTALQLTNHWQDVGLDLDKDRVYLPAEDLARFGLSYEDLARRRADGPFKRLMEYEVRCARALFLRGKPLCSTVGGRLAVELRAVWLGGWRILERVEQNGYDVFSRRPVITSADKRRIIWLALRKEAFKRY